MNKKGGEKRGECHRSSTIVLYECNFITENESYINLSLGDNIDPQNIIKDCVG